MKSNRRSYSKKKMGYSKKKMGYSKKKMGYSKKKMGYSKNKRGSNKKKRLNGGYKTKSIIGGSSQNVLKGLIKRLKKNITTLYQKKEHELYVDTSKCKKGQTDINITDINIMSNEKAKVKRTTINHKINVDDLLYCFQKGDNNDLFNNNEEIKTLLETIIKEKTKSRVNRELIEKFIIHLKNTEKTNLENRLKDLQTGPKTETTKQEYDELTKKKKIIKEKEKEAKLTDNFIIKNNLVVDNKSIFKETDNDSEIKISKDISVIGYKHDIKKNENIQYIILSETESSPKDDSYIIKDIGSDETLVETCNQKKKRSVSQCRTTIIKDIMCVIPKLLSNIAVFDPLTDDEKTNFSSTIKKVETPNQLPHYILTDTDVNINIFNIKDIIANTQIMKQNDKKIIFVEPVNTFMLTNDFMRYSTGIEKKNYCSRNKDDFEYNTQSNWDDESNRQKCNNLCQSQLIGSHIIKNGTENLTEEEKKEAANNPEKISHVKSSWRGLRNSYIESYNCKHIFNYSRFKSYIYDELIKYTGTKDKLLRYPDAVFNDIITKKEKISYFNYSQTNPLDGSDGKALYKGRIGPQVSVGKMVVDPTKIIWSPEEEKICGDDTLNVIHILAPPYKLDKVTYNSNHDAVEQVKSSTKYITKSIDKQATIKCYVSLFKTYYKMRNKTELGKTPDITMIIPILADYLNQKLSVSDLMYFNNNNNHEDLTITYIMESLLLLDTEEREFIITSIKDKKIILYIGGHLKGIQQTHNTTTFPNASGLDTMVNNPTLSSFKLDLKKNMITNFVNMYKDNAKYWSIGHKLLGNKL